MGIGGGMQIIMSIFEGETFKHPKIGLKQIFFKKNTLGENNTVEVYLLHNYYVSSKDFDVYAPVEKTSCC